MAMFTRTITKYQATAMRAVISNGEPKLDVVGVVEFASTNGSQGEARKIFKEQGIEVPRGTTIDIKPIQQASYGCTIDEFLSVAKLIETKDM